MKIAAYDLGTNSFLCLIGERRAGDFFELSDSAKVVRLGQGMYDGGVALLHPEAIQRARECLVEFTEKANRFGVVKRKAVATSAARDAKNVDQLVSICKELDIELEIISGEREAQLTFSGAVEPLLPNENVLVVDIGGGSTEFLLNSGSHIQSYSLNIGAVRLTDLFVSTTPNDKEEISAMKSHIADQLKSLSFEFSTARVVAVAGTPTTLASMKLGMRSFDKSKIDRSLLSLDDLEKQIIQMGKMDLQERRNIPGMQEGREDIILSGAILLKEIALYLGVGSVEVSTKGVRYGLAKEIC